MNSIIRIPFTGSVRLRSLLLKSGPGEQTPAKACQSSSRAIFHSTKIKGISQRYLLLILQSSLRISTISTFRMPKTRNLRSNSTSPLDAKSKSTRSSRQLHVSSIHFYATQLSFLVGPRNSLMCLPLRCSSQHRKVQRQLGFIISDSLANGAR